MPGGTYQVFAALVRHGALADNRIDAGDLLALDLKPITLLSTGPLIVTQPINTNVSAGQSETFTVVASGTAPLAYQWRRPGSIS